MRSCRAARIIRIAEYLPYVNSVSFANVYLPHVDTPTLCAIIIVYRKIVPAA